MQLVERLSETPASVASGRFRVLPHRRELLADGRRSSSAGRGFDVLIALLEGRGSVVSREELIRRVWPNRVVEETNLHAQISALRAALGGCRRSLCPPQRATTPGNTPRLSCSSHALVVIGRVSHAGWTSACRH
jgi:hypothetical protein